MSSSPLHERLHTLAAGRSFRHLAELTNTNAETVRRYMHGQSPSVEFLVALCRSMGVSAEWLLTGAGPMKLADLKGHVLRDADAGELLNAMAGTMERLIERVDRLERFVQTLEVRMISGEDSPAGQAPAGDHPATRKDHEQAAGTIREGKPTPVGRARFIADAVRPADADRR